MNDIVSEIFLRFDLSDIWTFLPIFGFILVFFFQLLLMLVFPGVLLLRIFGIKRSSFWESLVLSVGLSISIVMVIGLLINTFLPKFGVTIPLAKFPVFIVFGNFLLILFEASFFKYNSLVFDRKNWHEILNKIKNIAQTVRKRLVRKLSVINTVFISALLLLPVLSTIGAIQLNNNLGNSLQLITLFVIGSYILILTLFRNKISKELYPTSLYFLGLTLLLMTSLRSWYLSGHDVQFEYYIFKLTKENSFWNLDFYRDAYNACLSITVLPTIYSHFFNINDIYIFKVIFQIIFAFCPVVLYLFLSKYVNPYLSFIASFYFIAFPTFLNDMPMLNRQEIGLLFFALILFVLFRLERVKGKFVLLSFFSFGLVTSHYSTNYIATVLFISTSLAYIFIKTKFVKKLFRKYLKNNFILKKANTTFGKNYIPLYLVFILIFTTFIWNGVLTKTSNDLVNTGKEAIVNVGNIFKTENKSIDIAYSLFFPYEKNDSEFLDSYIKAATDKSKTESVRDFYDAETSNGYKPKIVQKETLELTQLGKVLSERGWNVFQINFINRQFFAKFIQLLIILGLVSIFFSKTKKKYDIQYVIASLVAVTFIVLMIILPGVSQDYGLLRLFQQNLVLLSLPIVLGCPLIFGKVRENWTLLVTAVISVLFFWSLSGFVSELTGGYYPQFNLRNKGIYYDSYYVHDSEIKSIEWLSGNMEENSTVQADTLTREKLLAYGKIHTLNGNLPQIIRKSAYVYAGLFNTLGKSVVSVDRSIVIQFPLSFLDSNKDLIYNNAQTRIYK